MEDRFASFVGKDMNSSANRRKQRFWRYWPSAYGWGMRLARSWCSSHRYVASLVRCFTGNCRELEIPRALAGGLEFEGRPADSEAEELDHEN
jgi:hypothetical protein